MKIEPSRSAGAASGAKRAGGAGANGFALPAEEGKAARPAAPMAHVSAVDAVLALQVEGGGARQRQRRRAAAQLDALDQLQAALLGSDSDVDIASLTQGLSEGLKGRESTGDEGLDLVLNDIDVRTAVEIAKRSRRGAGRA